MLRLTRERREIACLRGRAERHGHESCGADAEERAQEIGDFRNDERHAIAWCKAAGVQCAGDLQRVSQQRIIRK